MKDDSLVELENLAVGHGRQTVLESVNAVIPRGTFIGLLGANGSGKTTLLKTLARILPPLGGVMQFAAGPRPVITGYVPQRESLDPAFLLSCFEVVLMGACGRVRPGRMLGREERAWAVECLCQAGAGAFARKPFASLSGGQKQRILIARALVARPDLLLLDEPTAGVDAAAVEEIILLLGRLNAGGMTILMVNHDLPVVKRSVRTVFWARRGRLLTGEAAALLSRDHLEQLLSE